MKKLILALMLAFAAAVPTTTHAGFWSGIPIVGGLIDGAISTVSGIFGGGSSAAPAEEA